MQNQPSLDESTEVSLEERIIRAPRLTQKSISNERLEIGNKIYQEFVLNNLIRKDSKWNSSKPQNSVKNKIRAISPPKKNKPSQTNNLFTKESSSDNKKINRLMNSVIYQHLKHEKEQIAEDQNEDNYKDFSDSDNENKFQIKFDEDDD